MRSCIEASNFPLACQQKAWHRVRPPKAPIDFDRAIAAAYKRTALARLNRLAIECRPRTASLSRFLSNSKSTIAFVISCHCPPKLFPSTSSFFTNIIVVRSPSYFQDNVSWLSCSWRVVTRRNLVHPSKITSFNLSNLTFLFQQNWNNQLLRHQYDQMKYLRPEYFSSQIL